MVLVLNLTQGLDEYPSPHTKENQPSQLTSRQIIQKLAATLQARRFWTTKSFRVIVVATHCDSLSESELSTRIESFDTALRDILLPSCTRELICTKERIPFILNLQQPQKSDFETLNSIRSDEVKKMRNREDVEEIPASFLVFLQELFECSAHYPDEAVRERGCLSYDTCLEVGCRLGMGSDSVKAALLYLHRQSHLAYFHNVLPNCVFTKPQFPLN